MDKENTISKADIRQYAELECQLKHRIGDIICHITSFKIHLLYRIDNFCIMGDTTYVSYIDENRTRLTYTQQVTIPTRLLYSPDEEIEKYDKELKEQELKKKMEEQERMNKAKLDEYKRLKKELGL